MTALARRVAWRVSGWAALGVAAGFWVAASLLELWASRPERRRR